MEMCGFGGLEMFQKGHSEGGFDTCIFYRQGLGREKMTPSFEGSGYLGKMIDHHETNPLEEYFSMWWFQRFFFMCIPTCGPFPI